MNSGFRVNTESNRRQTMKQVKQAALRALSEYEVDWHSIHFIQLSEHGTFRIAADAGEQYLLRLHPNNKSVEHIRSELDWLFALKDKGLVVPIAAPNRGGDYITDSATDCGQRFFATMLTWIEGERFDKGALTEVHLRGIGAMMARMHEASDHFSPSPGWSRPVWGVRSLERDWAHLRKYHGPFISEEALELYASAVDKAVRFLETMDSNERYGMIHADLHIGNIVFRGDEPYPIDFGRCGYGYHLYDMAQAILGLWPAQRRHLINGYKKLKELEDAAIPKLECFFIMALIEAYSFHADNPAETEGLIEEQPYAGAILKAYVGGEPFLFQELPY